MGYVLQVDEGPLVAEMTVSGHHQAREYRVWVTATESKRWAEVVCECGASNRQAWIPGLGTFRELVLTTWALGCGLSALPFESFLQ